MSKGSKGPESCWCTPSLSDIRGKLSSAEDCHGAVVLCGALHRRDVCSVLCPHPAFNRKALRLLKAENASRIVRRSPLSYLADCESVICALCVSPRLLPVVLPEKEMTFMNPRGPSFGLTNTGL